MPAAFALCLLLAVLAGVWGSFALAYQLPGRGLRKGLLVGIWAACWLVVAMYAAAGHALQMLGPVTTMVIALLYWWRSIRPSNERVWAEELSHMLDARIEGSVVTLDNVRNFQWRSASDYTPRWETRRYDLDQLRSVDVLLSYWTGPLIAHVLVSFGFGDGRHLAFSIEIRKQRGETYSALGGFFRKFETSLIAADERDIVRLRSNVRREDVVLYRVALSQPAMRSLFLAYLAEAESLRRRPRWYNTATANCTTVVYEMMRHIVGHLPLDYRLLLSGYLPEYLHDVGGLTPGYSVAQLRVAGRIAARALAADADPAFSQRIRAGIPGIPDLTPAKGASDDRP